MNDRIKPFVVDLEHVNTGDILRCWNWCLAEMREILLVSKIGDLFLVGQDGGVYWLAIDSGGVLSKVAESYAEFNLLLDIEENIDNWFLPELIKKLELSQIFLKNNQVYSYKKMPVLGGKYDLNNIEPLDLSVYFVLTSQICEQIKDLPDGTSVKIVVKD